MSNIKIYDLHKNDYSKLHFELNSAREYFQRNFDHATIPHRHSFNQLIWFKEKGRHYIDFEIVDHKENTVFFIHKNQVHHFCTDSANEGFLFHFNDYYINRYSSHLMNRFSVSLFNEMNINHIELSKDEVDRIHFFTSLIQKELSNKLHFYNDQVFHLFQNVLLSVERRRIMDGSIHFNSDQDFALAVAFKKLVMEKMGGFYGIDHFASELNTNTKKLTRVSKKHLFDTPASIVKKNKILEAKRILANQKITIQEASYTLGFDQATYFTKYFKKETGLTPKEFQNSIR